MRLTNKIAVITGGVKGISWTIAELFGSEGATVIIWGLDDDGENIATTLQEKGYSIEFHGVDVNNYPQIQKATDYLIQKFGRIDILINNPRITTNLNSLKNTASQWEKLIQVNMSGVFNCTKAIVPYMKKVGYGRIINTTSIIGIRGNFRLTNYTAAKSAVIKMTEAWAKEFAKYRITTNAIAPGFIHTEIVRNIPNHIKITTLNKIPSKSMGVPKDVAYAFLFLASDEASYINGQTLAVDGGMM